MTIILALTFRTREPETIIWADRDFSDDEYYALSGNDLSVISDAREKALAKLARDMAERAYSLMTSGF
jgi:hypothetical protein